MISIIKFFLCTPVGIVCAFAGFLVYQAAINFVIPLLTIYGGI